jgi:hypothetical protein
MGTQGSGQQGDSRHNNLQAKLLGLGDLRRKLLWNVVDADLGKRPCNCPTKFKVNGVCAYGGDNLCCTSRTVHKISCLSATCNCIYIGKSQRYVKMHIQEHLGEVTKLCAKNILATNHCSQTTTPSPHTLQTQSVAQSSSSLRTQEETSGLDSVKGTPPICVVINNTATTTPQTGTNMHLQSRTPPDAGSISNTTAKEPSPIMTFRLPPNINPMAEAYTATCQRTTKQDICSALACHLYSHVRHLYFRTRANVATWCRSNMIKINIIWQLNPIDLQKTASTRFCPLCAVERMLISHNFTSTNQMRKIINLKSEMRGICSCKTRFLRFSRSD